VFREFNGAVKIAPDRAQIDWLAATYPDARLHMFLKQGNSRWRETKWLGNYRYAIVNMGGRDREDLFRRFDNVCSTLRFEREQKVRFASGLDDVRPHR
jgi:hypothetical protein